MTNFIDIVFTANSPGELWAQVRPTVEKIPLLIPNARIILVIPPCQYASGREAEVSRNLQNIYEVILPGEYKNWILKNQTPHGINFSRSGAVVFMGGDLLHAMLISKKLNFPAVAYCRDHFAWKNYFKMFLVPDEPTYKKALRAGVTKEKIKIVGNLISDSITLTMSKENAFKFWGLDPTKPVIGMMLGSRPFQYQNMTSFYLKVAEHLSQSIDAQFIMPISKFSSIPTIEKYLNPPNRIYKENINSPCSIQKEGKLNLIKTQSGIKVLLINELNYDAINICDIVLTLPGTNTAEIGTLGVPMISLLPLNRPGLLPLEGIAEVLSNIPLAGRAVKHIAIKIINKMVKYFALPNIIAGREIIPEIRGAIEPKVIAQAALDLLKNREKRMAIRTELEKVLGNKGASEKVVAEIKKIIL